MSMLVLSQARIGTGRLSILTKPIPWAQPKSKPEMHSVWPMAGLGLLTPVIVASAWAARGARAKPATTVQTANQRAVRAHPRCSFWGKRFRDAAISCRGDTAMVTLLG